MWILGLKGKMTSFAANRLLWSFAVLGKLRSFCYRYFEKGCRKKCTRQCPSRKVLWVALSWISYPEKFERTAREAIDVCLRLLKESNNIRFDSCSVRNSVLVDHIPYYLSGLSLEHFSDHLSRNSCIQTSLQRLLNRPFAWWRHKRLLKKRVQLR